MNKKQWRQQRREEGWKDTLIWLSPASLSVIEERKEKAESLSNCINRIIQGDTKTNINGNSLGYIEQSQSYISLKQEIEELRERVHKLENRLTSQNDTANNITKEVGYIDDYITKLKGRITQLREEGLSFSEIAKRLNEENLWSLTNKEWSKSAVNRFFNRHLK